MKVKVARHVCCADGDDVKHPCVAVIDATKVSVLVFTINAVQGLGEELLLHAGYSGDKLALRLARWALIDRPRHTYKGEPVGTHVSSQLGPCQEAAVFDDLTSTGIGHIRDVGWSMIAGLAKLRLIVTEPTRTHRRGKVRVRRRAVKEFVEQASIALWAEQP